MPNLSKNALPIPNLTSESIGKRLARLRKERGYSQAQLARKVGIEPKLVSDYETGKLRLYDMVIGRISIALDVTADTILGFNKLKSIDPEPSLRIWKRLKKNPATPILETEKAICHHRRHPQSK